jgi:hypothetical protein
MRRSLTHWVLAVYLLLVLAALGVAVVRLTRSTTMPGLSAIELVLLALPWSLALNVEPLSRLGWGGMTAIVLGGLGLNGLILGRLASGLQRGFRQGRGPRHR